jgi:DNA-binding CsgD family transcriptional regulator
LACLREDYAEGVRLAELAKRHTTNTLGFQLLYWAQAVLACGIGRPMDVRRHIQDVLQLSDPNVHSGTTKWLVPCAAYALVETDPEKAVELLAWVVACADTGLYWTQHWPLFGRLQAQLQTLLERHSYHKHWETGKALSLNTITAYIEHEFGAASDAVIEAPRQLLTAREREILGLMAVGLTNSQIAARLIIGAGTVKTHTLTIYRKLEVANRTQAIIRAQELGLLRA